MRKGKPWKLGEAERFVTRFFNTGLPIEEPKLGPWDQPCGEALVDWPRFFKWVSSEKRA